MTTPANQSVGIIGAGTMGADIAYSAALGGYQVRLYDTAAAARTAAIEKIGKALRRGVDKGRMTAAEAEAVHGRVQAVDALAAVGGCDIVIEAIVEVYDAKAALFESLSEVATDAALIATNTSSLQVSDLARHVRLPERFVGLHYFFPAAVNPLLEVIRGEASSEASVERALEFARQTRKTPVLCRDVFGFAVNRFFVPYLNESARLVGEGHAAAAVEDCALQELQAAVGPFRVMDLTKTIIAVHAARTLEQLGAFYRPADRLVEQGESGELWAVAPAPADDPEQYQTIRQRLLGAVFLSVLQALDQDVAAAGDFDLGAKIALQWGRQPCELMDELGRNTVTAMLKPLLQAYGAAMPAAIARVGRLREAGASV